MILIKLMTFIMLTSNFIERCSGQIFKPFAIGALPFISKNTNLCNEETQSAIVEDFFNTVFTEFLTVQPACVCIQLCRRHSTFCYPNGCFQHINNYVKNKDGSNAVGPHSAAPVYLFQNASDVENYDEVRTDKFETRNDENVIKATPSMGRSMALHLNPFKDRFRFLSYLTYKRPFLPLDTNTNNLKHLNHFAENEEIAKPEENNKKTNAKIDVKNTQWPSGKADIETLMREAVKQKMLAKGKKIKKTNISSIFDVEERINSIERQYTDEPKQEDLLNMDYTPFFSSNEVKFKNNGTDQLKVLPVKSTKINATAKIGTGSVNKQKIPESITNIIGNFTTNTESSTLKSYLSRRQPLFDIRRLKSQFRTKSRLGNELRAAHLHMAKKKQDRLKQRQINIYGRRSSMDTKEGPTSVSGIQKRSYLRDDTSMKISMGDIDVFNTTIKNKTMTQPMKLSLEQSPLNTTGVIDS